MTAWHSHKETAEQLSSFEVLLLLQPHMGTCLMRCRDATPWSHAVHHRRGHDRAGRHAGMARGIVKQLSGEEISVTLDKRLRRAFGPEPQHSAASSVEDVKGKSTAQAQGEVVDSTSQRHSWRLDKDEVASVFVRLRRNLMGEGLKRRSRMVKTLLSS